MKLFDPYAALAKIENQHPLPATFATSATQTPSEAEKVANVANVATPQDENPKSADRPMADTFPHGRAVNGNPKTWTGKIVSLDEWRSLSRWDRHGPDGRLWCGKVRRWIDPTGRDSDPEGAA